MATKFHGPPSLILLAQAGDRRALEELLKGVQESLFDFLADLVGNVHLAEDILQDVFVLLWRKLPWLRDPELFRPWLYRIASREAFRRLKKERSWWRFLGNAELEFVVGESAPEPVPPEQLDRLSQHLASISPASRAVLVLHYRQGLTLEEVADVLDLSRGTVKSRLAYGLAVLRRKLASQETADERHQSPG
jgi:RNA polymerase sigma-70 factor, ECF subfamily